MSPEYLRFGVLTDQSLRGPRDSLEEINCTSFVYDQLNFLKTTISDFVNPCMW